MKDVSGTELGGAQQELMGCYNELVRILKERRAELAPYEERNALKAVAALWQIANGLDMDPGQLYEVGA